LFRAANTLAYHIILSVADEKKFVVQIREKGVAETKVGAPQTFLV